MTPSDATETCTDTRTVPRAILLVPPEGDPDGLLKGGPGGYRPPVAVRTLEPRRWRQRGHLELPRWDHPQALLLAWDGLVVLEGCAHLGAWAAQLSSVLRPIGQLNLSYLAEGVPRRRLKTLADVLHMHIHQFSEFANVEGLSLVLLNADGLEIEPGTETWPAQPARREN